jgi:hypothetical protein
MMSDQAQVIAAANHKHDLRRAKALRPALLLVGAGSLEGIIPDLTEILLRTIRESDEAAGLVLVPRVATEATLIIGLTKHLPHPEQMILALRDPKRREQILDETRMSWDDMIAASFCEAK